jgi:hypothetical protein
MATKIQIIRKNFSEVAQSMVENAGLTAQKLTVKAIGGDVFIVKYGTSFERRIDGEDCFRNGAMFKHVEAFVEGYTEIAPDAVVSGYRDGYSSVAGEDNLNRVSRDDIVSIDTRVDCYHDRAMEEFWYFGGLESLKDEIEAKIGDLPISCYHYKGKRWEVAPNIASIEVSIYYLDEDDREMLDCYEGEWDVNAVVSDETKAIAHEIGELIRKTSKGVSDEGLVYSMLDIIKAQKGFFPKDALDDDLLDNMRDKLYGYMKTDYKGSSYGPDADDVSAFLAAEYPELKIINQDKMAKFASKLGFKWSFDCDGNRNNGSIKFTNRENSRDHYHVSYMEFLECDKDWKVVFRDVVQPMVKRRAMQEIDRIIKTKLQGRLKEVAQMVWVTFSDSLKAGNCEFGSRQFVDRNHINLAELGAIRGDALLEMENSDFTRRIILMKAANDANVRKVVGI